MAIPELKAKRRTETGSRACSRLRSLDQIPAVLYGHQKEAISVVLSREDFEGALRSGARTLKLAIEKDREQVVLKEVQYDALGERILHVDFARISEHEVITLEVEIRLQGTAKGVKDGGMLDQQLQEVEVKCPADAIPERILVRVDDLGLEEMIRLSDIEFPEGVLPTRDLQAVVVSIRKPEEEAVEAPAEPVVSMKEPEVITAREKKEEEEG